MLDPPHGPEMLAESLAQGLRRPIERKHLPKIVVVLPLAAISLGLAPLLHLPWVWRGCVRHDRMMLWHVVQWLRLRVAEPATGRLARQADSLRFHAWLPILSVLLALVMVEVWVLHVRGWRDLMAATYLFAFGEPANLTARQATWMFISWNACLSVACMLHWVHVQWHAAKVRRFVQRFGELLAAVKLEPIAPPPMELGLRPLWLVAGVVLALAGAAWGLPLMLAAGAQKRYMSVSGLDLCRRLADGIERIRAAGKPAVER